MVVIGAGHAGIEAVRALRKVPADVLLIDRRNYHKFQPLLYQVATAGLMAGNIMQPVRHIFRGQRNFEFRLARVEGIDFRERLIHVSQGPPVWYDYLILAAGASTAYFGVEGAEACAFPLKNVADALNLRAHILTRFEVADCDAARLGQGILTFVIVGGGPTGVETAGALRELFDHVLRRDFPALDLARARIVLVEMQASVLGGYVPRLQDYALRQLRRRGVEVILGTSVARVTPTEVTFANGQALPTQTVIWAAGVRANPLASVLGLETARAGRIVVSEHLRVPAHPEVYVVGDMAAASAPDGHLYPQLAPVAVQQGQHAARNIARSIEGREPEAFRYRDRGVMATIGRNAAVVQLPGGRTLTGRLAWLAWAWVHIVELVGFRNQFSVLLNWLYNYLSWDRGPRLIITARPETDELRTSDPPEAPLRGAAASDGAVPSLRIHPQDT